MHSTIAPQKYGLIRFYIGHTGDDLQERLRKHRSNHKGFTGKENDWEVAYAEEYASKQEAHARERQVKSRQSRHKFTGLIEGK